MIGYIIGIIAAMVVSFFIYDAIQGVRQKKYLERTDLNKEERLEEMREAYRDRVILITRFAIYTIAVIAAFTGNIWSIILASFFTLEAVAHILGEAASATTKLKLKAETALMLPFAVTVFAGISAITCNAVLGIIVGLVLLIGVRCSKKFYHLIDRTKDGFKNLSSDDAEDDELDEDNSTMNTAQRIRRPASN